MLSENFIKPLYDSGGFAGIPARILEACVSGDYDAVVLLLVDGFGWRFFEKYQHASFLNRFSKAGKVEKLTSQFPSTTAAHVTTIHTGQPVGKTGLFEWFSYEPQLDRIIAPLMFSYATDRDRDTLVDVISPENLYPRGTLYQELAKSGVQGFVFGARGYTPSPYSNTIMHGAKLNSFKTLAEALVNLGETLAKRPGPAYLHLYFDKIDSLCHEYGPSAPQVEAEIQVFLLIMEHFFTRIFSGKKKVLLFLTADHGTVEVDPETTIYLNRHPDLKGVERFLARDRAGELLVPAGSARDMFLYVREGMLDQAQRFLSSGLQGKASVVKTRWLMENGYFGPEISKRFRERVGDLVILPYHNESVWWYEKKVFEQNFYGHHGGLTPQEMEIPLLTLEIG